MAAQGHSASVDAHLAAGCPKYLPEKERISSFSLLSVEKVREYFGALADSHPCSDDPLSHGSGTHSPLLLCLPRHPNALLCTGPEMRLARNRRDALPLLGRDRSEPDFVRHRFAAYAIPLRLRFSIEPFTLRRRPWHPAGVPSIHASRISERPCHPGTAPFLMLTRNGSLLGTVVTAVPLCTSFAIPLQPCAFFCKDFQIAAEVGCSTRTVQYFRSNHPDSKGCNESTACDRNLPGAIILGGIVSGQGGTDAPRKMPQKQAFGESGDAGD